MKLFKEIFGVSAETYNGDYADVVGLRGALLKSAVDLARTVLTDHIASQYPSAPLEHMFRNKGPEAQKAAIAGPLQSAEIPTLMQDQQTLLNTQEPIDQTQLDDIAAEIYPDNLSRLRARIDELQQENITSEDLDLAV